MRSERGAALLLVLAIVGLLSLAVVEFIREARYETLSASNAIASVEALALARSGTAAGAAILKHDLANTTTDDRTEFWYAGEGDAALAVPVGDHTVSLHIEDLYGKFPIGAMVNGEGKAIPSRVAAYKRLLDALELEGVDPDDLVEALVDWMDEESGGDRYEVNENFTVPDAVPEHLDELSRIAVYKDLPRETLARIRSHLDTRSEPEVNVNTASVPVLLAIHPNLTREDAEAIYEELGSTPVANDSILLGRMPRSGRALPLVFKSPRFALVVKGDVREIVKETRCVVTRDFGKKTVAVSDWIQN